jgi:hypothetical protein
MTAVGDEDVNDMTDRDDLLPGEPLQVGRIVDQAVVVTLALEKPLFRNVCWKRPVVTLRGKKS